MQNFTKLKLKTEILTALSRLHLTTPSEVQEAVVPIAMQGKNLVFTAKTGSGKTLAYLLGFLGKINNKQGLQILVIVPTRELCIQVGKEIKKVCDHLKINVGMLYGGRDTMQDYRTFTKKNQILIGTPGRLLLHVNEKKIKIGEVRYLVFDESDQMFDQGFSKDCSYIKKRVSSTAQIILASATITDKVKRFINEIPAHEFIAVGTLIPKEITQQKIYCEMAQKKAIIQKIISKRPTLIFCNTKQKVHDLARLLEGSLALHSDLTQTERLNHLNLFKEGKVKILVTTDVAARGIHIEKADMVINYDVPTKEEFYVHRIGRTGRKGKKGKSITLICPEDEERFLNIETKYKLDIEELDLKE